MKQGPGRDGVRGGTPSASGMSGGARRSGSAAKKTAQGNTQYAKRVKQVVKNKNTRANDPSVMQAINKRGGTKPYSKMEVGVMKSVPVKGRKYKAPGKV